MAIVAFILINQLPEVEAGKEVKANLMGIAVKYNEIWELSQKQKPPFAGLAGGIGSESNYHNIPFAAL